MKRFLLILALVVVVSLLAACGPYPDEPKEVLPYCQAKYEELLAGQYPDLPPAYVGACVANWQTDNPSAFASLCGFEPFWASIEESFPVTIDSRQQCINFLQNLEDYTQN